MSWAPTFAAILFGLLSSFVVFHISGNHYNLRRRRTIQIPPFYQNPLTRPLYFLVAAILLLIALYFSTPWWITAIVISSNLIATQSGAAAEYRAELESMTRHLMENQGLSRDEAERKAKDIVETWSPVV